MATLPADQAVTRLQANEDRFDNFVNGEGYYDSSGESVQGLKDVVQGLATFNVRGAWAGATNYAIKDVYTNAGISYVAVVAHTSTSIAADLAAGKVTIFQNGVFTPNGLNALTQTILSRMLKTVYADEYATLRDAIAALPARGGVVYVTGRIKAGVWTFDTNYMNKDNVFLMGSSPPSFAYDCSALEGPSIIEGKFNVFANNFGVQNIGFDCGKVIVDRDFGGLDTHTANHPNGGTWDGFAFAQPSQSTPLPARRNFFAKNVIGLNRDSQSYGHAVLMEAFNGGFVDNVVGMYGIHGAVIKAQNVTVKSISGYGASVDHVIFKSDSYAIGGNITVDVVKTDKAPPGCVPWSAPVTPTYGLLLNPATYSMASVKISKAILKGATALLAADGPDASLLLDGLMISELEIDAFGIASAIAIKMAAVKHYRCKFGLVTISNVADGVAYAQSAAAGGFSADPLVIDSLTFSGSVTLRALNALAYGRIVINHLRIAGNVNILYEINGTARIHVGREELTGVLTTKFSLNAPTLTAGWQQYAGQQAFAVKLENFGVVIQGLLQRTATPDSNICSLPQYLRPAAATRLGTLGKTTGGGYVNVMIGGDPSFGFLQLNEGLNTTGTEVFLSLQGVTYGLD